MAPEPRCPHSPSTTIGAGRRAPGGHPPLRWRARPPLGSGPISPDRNGHDLRRGLDSRRVDRPRYGRRSRHDHGPPARPGWAGVARRDRMDGSSGSHSTWTRARPPRPSRAWVTATCSPPRHGPRCGRPGARRWHPIPSGAPWASFSRSSSSGSSRSSCTAASCDRARPATRRASRRSSRLRTMALTVPWRPARSASSTAGQSAWPTSRAARRRSSS